MLLRNKTSVLQAAICGAVSAFVLLATTTIAAAADQPADIAAASGITVSGNTVMMAPIPDKAPASAEATTTTVAPAGSDVVDEISLTERPAIIIRNGTITMMPIPNNALESVASSVAVDGPRSEKDCLARAIYFEARGESVRGQEAVAQVVLARVKSPSRPKTICGVVYEGSHLSTGCQFSFTCDGVADVIRDRGAWTRALRLAGRAMVGKLKQVARGALYYHASYVRPSWASHMVKVATIGTHIFYRP